MERDNRIENGQCLPISIVAGNKCDLQSMRMVGARDGLEWARARGYGFMETSAREMVNIEETFARKFVCGNPPRPSGEGNPHFPPKTSLEAEIIRIHIVIVRRVVEARKQHAKGIAPALPSSTARTRPLDPAPPSENEKDYSESKQRSSSRKGKSRFWHRLKCW